MTDENLLTAAKLREQVRRRIDGDDRLHPHTGLVPDRHDRAVLSFVEDCYDGLDEDLPISFEDSKLGRSVESALVTDAATEAVMSANTSYLAHLVGITEQDLDADRFAYTVELLDRVENNGAPCFVIGYGLPNSGKTGHILHDWRLAWRRIYPDGLMISNARIEGFDACLTSMSEIYRYCLDHPDRRKFLFVDEGSTHFDARTNSYEVASQFSPFAKRFAKLKVDFFTAGHTGMDTHPETKRLATTLFHKPDVKQVQFFDAIDGDDLLDPVFPDVIDGLEKPTISYDPDDWSPLDWDLDADDLAAGR